MLLVRRSSCVLGVGAVVSCDGRAGDVLEVLGVQDNPPFSTQLTPSVPFKPSTFSHPTSTPHKHTPQAHHTSTPQTHTLQGHHRVFSSLPCTSALSAWPSPKPLPHRQDLALAPNAAPFSSPSTRTLHTTTTDHTQASHGVLRPTTAAAAMVCGRACSRRAGSLRRPGRHECSRQQLLRAGHHRREQHGGRGWRRRRRTMGGIDGLGGRGGGLLDGAAVVGGVGD